MADSNVASGCPAEVAGPVLAILSRAMLWIRVAGWNNRPEYCAIEADHIHILPSLLPSYSRELLEHYLEVTRPSYLDQLGESQDLEASAFQPMWVELERYLGRRPG